MNKVLINNLKELLEIDSPSGGENKVREFILNKVRQLPIKINIDKIGNLKITSNYNKIPKLLLVAHMDTVLPTKKLKFEKINGKIVTKSESILGGDNKCGVAILLSLILMNATNEQLPSVEFLFTVREELGVVGLKKIKTPVFSKNAIVLDEDGGPENIITEAIGASQLKIDITGSPAHSTEAKSGVNALNYGIAIAEKINTLKLSEKIEPGSIINIGIFKAGTAINCIPHKLSMSIDLRSFKNASLLKLERKMEAISKSICKKEVKIIFNNRRVFDSFLINKDSSFLQKYLKVLKNLNINGKCKSSTGGYEANILNAIGIESFVIGCGQNNVHSFKEKIVLKDFFHTLNALQLLINKGIS